MIELDYNFFSAAAANMSDLYIGAPPSPFSERVFYFFSDIVAATTAIYPAGGTLPPWLVFNIDSNVLLCFYGTVETAIADIPPYGAPP